MKVSGAQNKPLDPIIFNCLEKKNAHSVFKIPHIILIRNNISNHMSRAVVPTTQGCDAVYECLGNVELLYCVGNNGTFNHSFCKEKMTVKLTFTASLLKEIVHLFSHLHFVPNMYDWLSSKRSYFDKLFLSMQWQRGPNKTIDPSNPHFIKISSSSCIE